MAVVAVHVVDIDAASWSQSRSQLFCHFIVPMVGSGSDCTKLCWGMVGITCNGVVGREAGEL